MSSWRWTEFRETRPPSSPRSCERRSTDGTFDLSQRSGRRSGRRVDGAEVTLDSVEVLDGQRVASRFTEIEAELVADEPRRLAALERRLCKAGARATDGRSKLRRVLDPAEPEHPGKRAPAVAQVRALLRAQYEQLLRHDPGVRVGGEPEDVHAMRVAVRRLRAVLRAARPMLDPEWVEGLRAELDWLGDHLLRSATSMC